MTNKQVKNELYTNKNSTWTFKNIQLRKFTTGVYDYSLFSSVFTPIDLKTFPQSLKVTATSQEWCGTIFTQLNFKDSRFNVEQRSYFEREGDVNYTTEEAFIEEEIFTVLRMNSQLLTTGNFTMIPSLNFNQLKHLKTKSVNVKAAIWTYKESEFQGEKLNEYRVVFPDLKRKLRIIFENKAPYKIVAWLDSFPSAFDKQIRTTKAILKKQKMLSYWPQNSLNDSKLRKELGL